MGRKNQGYNFEGVTNEELARDIEEAEEKVRALEVEIENLEVFIEEAEEEQETRKEARGILEDLEKQRERLEQEERERALEVKRQQEELERQKELEEEAKKRKQDLDEQMKYISAKIKKQEGLGKEKEEKANELLDKTEETRYNKGIEEGPVEDTLRYLKLERQKPKGIEEDNENVLIVGEVADTLSTMGEFFVKEKVPQKDARRYGVVIYSVRNKETGKIMYKGKEVDEADEKTIKEKVVRELKLLQTVMTTSVPVNKESALHTIYIIVEKAKYNLVESAIMSVYGPGVIQEVKRPKNTKEYVVKVGNYKTEGEKPLFQKGGTKRYTKRELKIPREGLVISSKFNSIKNRPNIEFNSCRSINEERINEVLKTINVTKKEGQYVGDDRGKKKITYNLNEDLEIKDGLVVNDYMIVEGYTSYTQRDIIDSISVKKRKIRVTENSMLYIQNNNKEGGILPREWDGDIDDYIDTEINSKENPVKDKRVISINTGGKYSILDSEKRYIYIEDEKTQGIIDNINGTMGYGVELKVETQEVTEENRDKIEEIMYDINAGVMEQIIKE